MDSFETNLEADIQRLAAEVRSQRERPEMTNASERDLVKEAIRSFPEGKNQPANTALPAPTSSGAAAGADDRNPLPSYAANAPAEIRLEIEYLLDLALKKGIGQALSEAGKSSAFVQDAFHDALAGKLYPELQRRGMVK